MSPKTLDTQHSCSPLAGEGLGRGGNAEIPVLTPSPPTPPPPGGRRARPALRATEFRDSSLGRHPRCRSRSPMPGPRRPTGPSAGPSRAARSAAAGSARVSALRQLTRRRCPSAARQRRAEMVPPRPRCARPAPRGGCRNLGRPGVSAGVRRRDPDASIAAESARRADRPVQAPRPGPRSSDARQGVALSSPRKSRAWTRSPRPNA